MKTEPFSTIYAKNILDLAKLRKDKVFYNSSMAHAVVVHQALVNYAEDYVDIFCGSMSLEISNEQRYCELMNSYLRKAGRPKVDVILTNYPEKFADTRIAKVFADYPEQVRVKYYNGYVLYKDKPAHFAVVDNRAFRLETDIDKHMAFGNFNSPPQAIALKNIFDKIFNSRLAEDISLL